MTLHFATYLARSPTHLLAKIQTLKNLYAGHDLSLLFALSSNFSEAQDLERAVNGLLSLENTRTIGCLSGRLGSTRLNGKCIDSDVLSLSVSVFDSGSVIPFRSTIPGREEAQVGRWHAFRRKKEVENEPNVFNKGVSWEEVWEGGKDIALPQELQSLSPSGIQGILYFSDLKPEGLLSSFKRLPNVPKFGLLASSTPFITGRPVTLFRNKEVFESGAVGLAFTGAAEPELDIEFLDIRKLGEVMTVTQCEGNMVNSLNGTNPTRLLISAIKDFGLETHVSGSFKEEEQFSLGALTSDGKINHVYRITAGDPSRGSISVDSPSAPPPGTRVQFLHRPSTSIPHLCMSQNSKSLNFLTVTDELDLQSHQLEPSNDFELDLENLFLASSENGFVLERAAGTGETVKCSLVGGLGSLTWPSPA